jgi:hypothetical protein
MQPYERQEIPGGSWEGTYTHPLSLLHDLANENKHRDDWPTLAVSNNVALRDDLFPPLGTPERLKAAMEFSARPTGIGQPLNLNQEVMRARLPTGTEPEIDDAGRVTPKITFSEGSDVVRTLERIERYVHLILSEIAETFP